STLYYSPCSLTSTPFLPLFIPRLSKPPSIPQFISPLLLLPPLLSFLSFTLFPLLPIQIPKKHSHLFKISAQTQLFGLFNHLPLPIILSLLPLILIPSFFITSPHSPTFLLPMQTTYPS
ncbi:BCCT family transporter, partial [Staphylococcus hominis]|uniref:BCCT family transporter n=1 Tax=Staphylococcus hominis TaxID=1290 RepID=UPI001643B73F